MSATARTAPPPFKKLADLLLTEGHLSAEQYGAACEHAARTTDRIEEVVLQLGFLTEAELLKALATHYKTHFVSTEKLAKADIAKPVLDMIPRRFAEAQLIVPVLFDPKTHALSVVTCNPENKDALKEVQLASGAREVKAFVSRPAAVRAAIGKAYGGDLQAFAALERQAQLQAWGRNTGTGDALLVKEGRRSTETGQRASIVAPAPRQAWPSESFLELLNVMVNLVEGGVRAELRGHSGQVARLVRQMAERMGLDAPATATALAAAYAHDLGKMGQYHLTALNCSEYEGHKVAAQRSYNTPARLLEPVKLDPEILAAINHMYERYDGKGFPDGLAGKEIPLASRLLSICDTYADLTLHARNPFRKLLTAQEACAVFGKYKGTIYDPNLVDLFRLTVQGDDIRARLLQNRYTALIVDIDAEETTVVELRMIEQGFVVKTARSAEQAQKLLAGGDVDLVVSELDLGADNGLALLEGSREKPWGKELPWVVYTRRQEKAEAQRAFELGVLDFVAKPANAEVLVAKLKALLDQRAAQRGSARGVSGSLQEIPLPDMVQVLFYGRKTGNLRIRSRNDTGEIHLHEGAVVNAIWGDLRGEDAFYAMMRLKEGDFALDPTFKPPTRSINQQVDALLLEAMRRLDEGIGV